MANPNSKQVELPVYVVDVVSGRCESARSGEESLNGRCIKQGTLRECEFAGEPIDESKVPPNKRAFVARPMPGASCRSVLCDGCASRIERAGYKLRAVLKSEVGQHE